MDAVPHFIETKFRPIERPRGNRFQMSASDRGKLLTAKLRHKKELRRVYGKDWKKHLNVPEKSLGKSVHISF